MILAVFLLSWLAIARATGPAYGPPPPPAPPAAGAPTPVGAPELVRLLCTPEAERAERPVRPAVATTINVLTGVFCVGAFFAGHLCSGGLVGGEPLPPRPPDPPCGPGTALAHSSAASSDPSSSSSKITPE